MLTAAPAWARFATQFQVAAADAPLIVRARVLDKKPSQQYLDSQGVDVRLAVERTLVGPSVGRRLTLPVSKGKSDTVFKEGSVYLLLLEAPDKLFYTNNHCGTQNIREVVGGKVPRFQSIYPVRPNLTDFVYEHTATLAEAEGAIIAARCHDGQICVDDSSRLRVFWEKISLNHVLMTMAFFALAGYSLLLARRRTAQALEPMQPL